MRKELVVVVVVMMMQITFMEGCSEYTNIGGGVGGILVN